MAAFVIASLGATPASGAAFNQPAADAAPDYRSACPSVQRAIKFYSLRVAYWRDKMGAAVPQRRGSTGGISMHSDLPGRCPRYRAHALQRKSYATRTRAEMWIAEHVLSDFRVLAGARAWHQAVAEAQKPYPGTTAWLLSCSASEGGWGRWVPNSQGSGVGGWLQFHPSTFAGFSWRARVDAARRGYIVPGSASSWYSPLGQALAGAWGITHGMRSHWAGSGCR